MDPTDSSVIVSVAITPTATAAADAHILRTQTLE
jgi:hypothetical protein